MIYGILWVIYEVWSALRCIPEAYRQGKDYRINPFNEEDRYRILEEQEQAIEELLKSNNVQVMSLEELQNTLEPAPIRGPKENDPIH